MKTASNSTQQAPDTGGVVILTDAQLAGVRSLMTAALDAALAKMGDRAKRISWFTGDGALTV